MTKLEGQPTTMTISAATPSMCTTSTPLVMGLWRTGKRILDHLRKKEAMEPSSTCQTSIIREGACQAETTVEAHTHSSIRTACTMAVKPTIAQKIAPYSMSQRKMEQDSNQPPQ
jgi:hypothetical protein